VACDRTRAVQLPCSVLASVPFLYDGTSHVLRYDSEGWGHAARNLCPAPNQEADHMYHSLQCRQEHNISGEDDTVISRDLISRRTRFQINVTDSVNTNATCCAPLHARPQISATSAFRLGGSQSHIFQSLPDDVVSSCDPLILGTYEFN
jgi:hypothetical protein